MINGILIALPSQLNSEVYASFDAIPNVLYIIGMSLPGLLWPLITVLCGEKKARLILLVQASIWACIGLGFLRPETPTGFTTYTVIGYFAFQAYISTQNRVRDFKREKESWRNG